MEWEKATQVPHLIKDINKVMMAQTSDQTTITTY